MNRLILRVVGALVVGAVGVSAFQPPAQSTTPAARDNAAPAKPDPTKLATLAFLKGTWGGTMNGDPVEETWSAPSADTIIGMFRWQHDGATTMYELLAIKNEPEGPTLRLRHFDAKFEPWKNEAAGVAAMRAAEVSENRVLFKNESDVGGLASCEYHRTNPDTLAITVSFKDAKREPLKFELKKQ